MGCVASASGNGPIEPQFQLKGQLSKKIVIQTEGISTVNDDHDESKFTPLAALNGLVCNFRSEVVNGLVTFTIPEVCHMLRDTLRAYDVDKHGPNMHRRINTRCSDWNMHLFILFESPGSDINNAVAGNDYNYTNDNNHDKTWQKFSRTVAPHRLDGVFFIKVPFYLQEYYIRVKIQFQHKFKLNYITPVSDEYKIKIESFLVEPKLSIGEEVTYRIKNAAYCGSGIINQILENDEYKIEDDYDYTGNGNGKKQDKYQYIHRSLISRDSRFLDYGIDTCSLLPVKKESGMNMNMNMNIHRYNAECDLLLKTRDKKLRNYYWRLRNIIASIIPIKFKSDDDKWNGAYIYNFEYIGALLSKIITNYLYFDQLNDKNKNKNKIVNYKIRCFINPATNYSKQRTIDGYEIGYMYMDNQWKHEIECAIFANKYKFNANVMQEQFETSGWSCDLCRITINMNDWMYRSIPACSITHHEQNHDYCLQCTYTMANGIIAFENSLEKIVHKYIDKKFTMDCIKEIVAFTIGTASISLI